MSAEIILTFDDPFDKIAGLRNDWPHIPTKERRQELVGKVRMAGAYWNAANMVYAARDVRDFLTFAGPVMQNVGITCELILKSMLFGYGHSNGDLKAFGHSLSDLYDEAEKCLDIYKFLPSVISASTPLELPEEIASNFAKSGETREQAEVGWRVFSPHIHLLNESYDRPFRARYMKEGPLVLPEPFILLIGSAILLNAMNHRLELPLIGVAG